VRSLSMPRNIYLSLLHPLSPTRHEVDVLGDLQGPKFRVGELADGPITIADGDVLEFGLATDADDKIRPGRITMFETTEQTALMRGLVVRLRMRLVFFSTRRLNMAIT